VICADNAIFAELGKGDLLDLGDLSEFCSNFLHHFVHDCLLI
jgi:hypothetical protein